MNDLDNRPEVERTKYRGELERLRVSTDRGGADLIVVRDDHGEDYAVWTYLPDHPWNAGFVLGCGATRDEAVADAVALLEAMTAALQAGPVAEAR